MDQCYEGHGDITDNRISLYGSAFTNIKYLYEESCQTKDYVNLKRT